MRNKNTRKIVFSTVAWNNVFNFFFLLDVGYVKSWLPEETNCRCCSEPSVHGWWLPLSWFRRIHPKYFVYNWDLKRQASQVQKTDGMKTLKSVTPEGILEFLVIKDCFKKSWKSKVFVHFVYLRWASFSFIIIHCFKKSWKSKLFVHFVCLL